MNRFSVIGVGVIGALFAALLLLVIGLTTLPRQSKAEKVLAAKPESLAAFAIASGLQLRSDSLLNASYIPVDAAKCGEAAEDSLLYIGPKGAVPDEKPVATTAQVERAITLRKRAPGCLERLLAEALWHPERCAPGPCVALGATIDSPEGRRVPAVLYENGHAYLYTMSAEPHDGWNSSFKFVTEPLPASP